MGIRLQYLDLIDAASAPLSHRGSVWFMGSQQCRFDRARANGWLERRGHPRLLQEEWDGSPAPIARAMGFANCVDVDLNGRARVQLDLTAPLRPEHNGVADLVVDSGTLEHIFDARTALENMNRLLRPGGVILHLSPVTYFEHGFVNFNPRYFDGFYARNDYRRVFSTFHVTLHTPLRVPRIGSWTPRVLARFNLPIANGSTRDWSSVLRRFGSYAPLPRRLIFAGAYRKSDARTEFCLPLDVPV